MDSDNSNSQSDYTKLGFDQFLSRTDSSVGAVNSSNNSSITGNASLLSSSTFSSNSTSITGGAIRGGVITSQNQRLTIDLDNGIFNLSDGATDRVKIGVLDDGSVGMVLKDQNGNIIFQISGTSNFIQSSNQHMLLDFIAENIAITNEGGIPTVLLGKLN